MTQFFAKALSSYALRLCTEFYNKTPRTRIMGFYSVVAVCFISLVCLSQMEASVIPKEKAVKNEKLEEYYLHIMEKGTTFAEKIEIDEEKDLEYLHVPAHNQVTEPADYLYDFKSEVAVRRVKSEASCYVGPLPDDLPKPAELKTELQGKQSQVPPFQNKVTVHKYWVVSELEDKTLLSENVQEFCGEFPVYRLQEVSLNFTKEERVNGDRTRSARDLEPLSFLNQLGFCKKDELEGVKTSGKCAPDDYVFTIKISENYCTWWRDCKLAEGAKSFVEPCDNMKHLFNSMVCYTVRCP